MGGGRPMPMFTFTCARAERGRRLQDAKSNPTNSLFMVSTPFFIVSVVCGYFFALFLIKQYLCLQAFPFYTGRLRREMTIPFLDTATVLLPCRDHNRHKCRSYRSRLSPLYAQFQHVEAAYLLLTTFFLSDIFLKERQCGTCLVGMFLAWSFIRCTE